ncbi:MAG: YceI family protein [Saprospiraceae bacterium]|nr:YceI family protein [Saprospiraceae bacterium]
MKFLVLSLSFLLSTSLSFANGVLPASKAINTATSNVNWKGYKVTGSHEGNIKFKSGSLAFNEMTLTGGELIVDMNSLDCTDLQGGGKGKLEGHLKSDDFFGVAAHPNATIKFTKVVSRGVAGEYKITANITIKNITKEIKFNATAKDGTANATIKLDRSDFDIKYGSGSFFDNLGDKTIYDEFDLAITLNY